MRTEVDSEGATPSRGSNCVKEELGVANDQTCSVNNPSIFGGVGVRTAAIFLSEAPANASIEKLRKKRKATDRSLIVDLRCKPAVFWLLTNICPMVPFYELNRKGGSKF